VRLAVPQVEHKSTAVLQVDDDASDVTRLGGMSLVNAKTGITTAATARCMQTRASRSV
jgi:hypothetical protein